MINVIDKISILGNPAEFPLGSDSEPSVRFVTVPSDPGAHTLTLHGPDAVALDIVR